MLELSDLPAHVRKAIPTDAQRVYLRAYAATEGDSIAKADRAWHAVREAGWRRGEDGQWRKVDKRLGRLRAMAASLRLAMAQAGVFSKSVATQPRDQLGRWTIAGGWGGGGGITAPQLGIGGGAKRKFEASDEQKPFLRPLTQSEMTGEPPFLDNPEGYVLKIPSQPTPLAGNANPEDVATFTPDSDPGPGLNGIPFEPWGGPAGGDWTKVDGTGDFDEPAMPATKLRVGAGVIIEEPDGRVWTVNPLNQFGGYTETFPKGGIEDGLNLRQTAIKEAWEESGLKIELTGYVGDFERTTSFARFYTARRVGGSPTDHEWETQSTNLVPKAELAERVPHHADKPVLAALQGENKTIQKALQLVSNLWNAIGGILEKKGAWSKQVRVPAGLPTGGQWTTYGGGGYGSAFAAGGMPLKLQMHGGTGPQSEALNAKIAQMEADANAGHYSKAMIKLLNSPEPKQTYSKAAYHSAKEAVAYVDGTGVAGSKAKTSSAAPKAASKTMSGEGTAAKPFKLSEFEKYAEKPGGSAAGAVYTAPDGTRWLVKSYDTPEQARNEVAAASIYKKLGVRTPDMGLIDLEGAHKGGIGVASKWMDDVKAFDVNNPAHVKAAQEDFAAHAFMANWDTVGLSFDNLMIDGNGKAVMIDPGGAMFFRAEGKPKGAGFAPTVGELESMRDPAVNANAAAVFGSMTASEISASMNKVVSSVANEQISGLFILSSVGSTFGSSPTATTIKQRMLQRFDDMKAKAAQANSDLVSTSALDISTTGTTTAVLDHADPGVKALLSTKAPDAIESEFKAAWKNVSFASIALKAGENSTPFYQDKIKGLLDSASHGNIDAVMAAKYVPKSKTALLSENYGKYLHAFENTVKMAQAKAAMNALKSSDASGGAGGLVTGAAKLDASAAGLKLTGNIDAEQAKAIVEANAPVPKAASPAPKQPLPAMPPEPKLSSPTNKPVKSLEAAKAAILDIVKKGDPDAAVQVQAVASTIKGTNTYAKNAKTWAADVVAALGGQHSIDAMPAAAKKTAFEAGLEQATKSIKTIGSVKIETSKHVAKFDPEAIPEPPSFSNWDGNGKGLSSHPEFNADNDAKVGAIYASGKVNDLPGVQKIDPGPSKHVGQYKSSVEQTLKSVGTVIETTKFIGTTDGKFDAADVAMDLGSGIKSKQNWDPSATKFHAFVVAGQIDKTLASAIFDGIPSVKITPGSDITGKLLDQSHQSTKASISAMKAHTGGTYYAINNELRFGQKGTKAHTKALNRAKAIEAGVYELPVGLTLSRKVSVGTKAEWQSRVGDILTEPGITSTSISPGKWMGNVYLKLKVGKGVKGAYVGPASKSSNSPISQHSSENEVILPRNSKWLVSSVKDLKAGESDDFFKDASPGATIVEIVVMPNDPATD